MKQAWQKLINAEDRAETFHTLSTVFMILLFLTFWGVSFYVLITSLA